MKKQLNANQVLAIKNSFAPEGQAAADALIEAINAMAADETKEFSLEDLDAKVTEILAGLKEVPEAVQEMISNAIELKMKAVSNAYGKKGISNEIKREAAKAILNSRSAEEVQNSLREIAVKNGIANLTFADVVDYSLVDKFGDENELFAKLRKTEITKFFYVSETMQDALAIAKEHTKGATKDIQELTANGKTMTPKLVYKRQTVDVEDMLRLKKAGREANLVAYLTAELRRVLTNTEVMAILVGDTVNPVGKRISSFETIGNKAASDIWTIVDTAAASMPTVAEVRALSDQLYNPNGYEIVAVMNKPTTTALANYHYAAGGDDYFRAKEDLAGQLGVDSIYNTNLVPDGKVILLIPEEYYVHNEGEIEVAYDIWENNTHNFQYERLDCGAIHGLESTAVLNPA